MMSMCAAHHRILHNTDRRVKMANANLKKIKKNKQTTAIVSSKASLHRKPSPKSAASTRIRMVASIISFVLLLANL